MMLHDRTTTISNGTALTVQSMKSIGVSIAGTSTDFNVVFEASFNGTDFYPIMGRKADDTTITFITSVSELNKIILFNVASYIKFRARVESINDGYVTIEASEER